NDTNTVSVLLGNGNGTFQSPSSIGFGNYYPQSVAVGDFNDDGNLDIAVTSVAVYWWYGNYYIASATVLLGTGTGTFSAPISSTGGNAYPNSAVVADLNGDLTLDVAWTTDGGYVNVAPGNGTGGFGYSTSYGAGYQPRALAAGDVNMDGKPDLVTADIATNT